MRRETQASHNKSPIKPLNSQAPDIRAILFPNLNSQAPDIRAILFPNLWLRLPSMFQKISGSLRVNQHCGKCPEHKNIVKIILLAGYPGPPKRNGPDFSATRDQASHNKSPIKPLNSQAPDIRAILFPNLWPPPTKHVSKNLWEFKS